MNTWKFKQYIKQQLEKFPKFYISYIKFKNRNNTFLNRIVSKKTDIVIEGYPRSSNSFAVKAFVVSQNKKMIIATHTHSHTQVLEAIRLGVPTLVLIRFPDDCIMSLKAMMLELNNGSEKIFYDRELSVMIDWYISFYSTLMPYRNAFIWATFDEVITDYRLVIQKVNTFYHTNFNLFEHTKENVDKLFTTSSAHLSPSEHRNKYKSLIKSEYESDKNKSKVEQARALYYQFISEIK